MEFKKKYLRPVICQIDLYCAGLLAESGGSTGYDEQPGQEGIIYDQRRRSIWDTNDWMTAGYDNKEA